MTSNKDFDTDLIELGFFKWCPNKFTIDVVRNFVLAALVTLFCSFICHVCIYFSSRGPPSQIQPPGIS